MTQEEFQHFCMENIDPLFRSIADKIKSVDPTAEHAFVVSMSNGEGKSMVFTGDEFKGKSKVVHDVCALIRSYSDYKMPKTEH